MGKCWSSDLPYRVLRESVVGSLIASDHEFDQFYQICRTEMHTISSSLSIFPTQAFYVVVAGEVVVNLSDSDSKPIAVNVYQPGDIIFFFRSDSISHGALVCDKLKLTLQFRSKDSLSLATVIGADFQAVDKFLSEHTNLTALQSFCSLRWNDFVQCPIFESMKMEQMNMLGPLLKIKLSKSGQVLSLAHKSHAPKNDGMSQKGLSQKSQKSTVETAQSSPGAVACCPTYHTGIILTGRCLVVPSWVDLGSVTKALGPMSGKLSSHSHNHPTVARRHSVIGSLMNAVGINVTPEEYLLEDEFVPSGYIDSLASKLQNEVTQIFAGSMFGLENFFAQDATMALDSIVSLDSALIGYIDYETLQLFSQKERRFKRVIQRNFFKGLLNTVRSVIPMLSDIDEKHYALLASLVSLKFINKNEMIYEEGTSSESSYIVIRGMVKEADHLDSTVHFGNASIPANHFEHLHQSRLLGYGSLFGEVSLITETPYFTSTYAIEPSALICISKHAFERIYNKDKTKLAEIRIRLVGYDIEFQHILDHPKCNKQFIEYLKKQVAVENIYFLNAVAKFDDMTERLKKEMWKVLHEYASNTIHAQQLQARKPSISNTSTSGRLVLSTLPNMADNGFLRSSLIITANNSGSHDEIGAVRHHSIFMRESFLRQISDEIHMNTTNSTTSNGLEQDVITSNHPFPLNLIARKSTMLYLDNLAEVSDSVIVAADEEDDIAGAKKDNDDNNNNNIVTESEELNCPPLAVTIPHPGNSKPSSRTNSPSNAALLLRNTKDTSTKIPTKQLTEISESPSSISNEVVVEATTTTNETKKAKTPLEKKPSGQEIPNILVQYQRKFEKNLLELKEVAKNIMEKFISVNGEYEINIPQQMKFKTIANFEISMKLSVEHCMEALYDTICTTKLIEEAIERNEINHVDSTVGILNLNENSHSHHGSHHGLAGLAGLPISPARLKRTHPDEEDNTNANTNTNTNVNPFFGTSTSIKNTVNNNNTIGHEEIELWSIFEQSKTEIFKLLNNDCFMRWKNTPEFKTLIKSFQVSDDTTNNTNTNNNSHRNNSTNGNNGINQTHSSDFDNNNNSNTKGGPIRQSFDGSVYSMASGFQGNNEFGNDFMGNGNGNNGGIRGMGGGYNHRRPVGSSGGVFDVPLFSINSEDSRASDDNLLRMDTSTDNKDNKKSLVGLKGIFQKKTTKGVAISG